MRTLYARRLKRPLDLVLSGGGLLALSPLLAGAACAIKLESRGPVFFSQRRVGLGGKEFDVLKFRSMRSPEESFHPDGSEMSNSERMTRVGRLLRRTSLDEIPQLFNVLRGEMSLIGPRPTLPYQVERYTEHQRGRLAVRPGLTGLAQVSGRNQLTWQQKIEYDLEYAENVSLLGDLRILLRTAGAVLDAEGQTFTAHDALSDHGQTSYLKHI